MLKSDTHRFYYIKENEAEDLLGKYSIPSDNRGIDLLSEDLSFDSLYHLCQDIDLINQHFWSESTYQILNILRRYVRHPAKYESSIRKNMNRIMTACNELRLLEYETQQKKLQTYSVHLTEEIEKYSHSGYGNFIPEMLSNLLNSVVSIQQAFLHIQELHDKKSLFQGYQRKLIKNNGKFYSVCNYIKGILGSEKYHYKIGQGILNAAEFGVPQRRQRFILIGVRGDDDDVTLFLAKVSFVPATFRTIRDAIEDLENIDIHYETTGPVEFSAGENKSESLAKELCDTFVIHNHVITKTRETALSRFVVLKKGQNFHDLDTSMKDTYTDVSKTKNTIYQRLKYDEPSGTVLNVSNVRKSMWIHPVI